MVNFGDPAYWEQRYVEERKDKGIEFSFDWYVKYKQIHDFVSTYTNAKKDLRVLVVGCGNSRLSEDMYEKGYKNIVSVDISPSVIATMQYRCREKEGMEFLVMDARRMSAFADGSFNIIIDKGTMDSLFCGFNSIDDALAMNTEVRRLLAPDGHYIIISYGAPDTRLPYLRDASLHWHVEHTYVPGSANHLVYICSTPEGVDGDDDAQRIKEEHEIESQRRSLENRGLIS